MKKAQRESFSKSFVVFFLSLTFLSAILGVLYYNKLAHEMQEKIYNEMRVCSYDLTCSEYHIDFVPFEKMQIQQLKQSSNELYALFPIPKNETYALKIALSLSKYQQLMQELREHLAKYYLLGVLLLMLISALFSWYTLHPLNKALHLTEEFSRDILHDLATPLAALRLNVSRLKGVREDEKKIMRIAQSIETINSLGNNLRAYLEEYQNQSQYFNLHVLLAERILIFEKLFPDRVFKLSGETLQMYTNKDAFVRILDNLLSNAAKYNIVNGFVKVSIDTQSLSLLIEDSGKGIAHPEKIFERFYKEHERGLGIGLHIVQKLSKELKIKIAVESHVAKGTRVLLDLAQVTVK